MPENRLINTKVPEFRSIYCNNTSFQTGPFDFAMTFGEVTEVKPAEQVAIVEQRVRVTMAPLHAKIFMNFLTEQVHGYEQKYGEIIIPPGTVVKEEAEEAPEKAIPE